MQDHAHAWGGFKVRIDVIFNDLSETLWRCTAVRNRNG
ncbi:Unknown protein sequence [Pseudomonas amygdali pv. lachrymans]|uniref:Uncharacterized protein n=1 Tax=Pseudomonas amygdali pv. lachrymans TaxID=53707 RepID=A0ABR5KQ52_PSEAV|nr:Unknown protein sequence [Pseudomonas amygdali pv. lachrymans]KPC16716.1 Unknown protein sequence [Pseudomonas amygdali pv. lachrymans]RMP46310.1 hypothetical protein ALQ26_102890 [Pseudomonas amygdali pv. lachrymans]